MASSFQLAELPSTQPIRRLSKREIEVVNGLWEGLTEPQIAERLGLSVYTIANHKQRVKRALRCRTVIDVLRKAQELRLLVS